MRGLIVFAAMIMSTSVFGQECTRPAWGKCVSFPNGGSHTGMSIQKEKIQADIPAGSNICVVNEEEIGWLAESGTHVSISILSNLRCGMGLPPVLAMTRAGVAVALSMDTMGASDNSDMFAAMRVTLGIERAKADDGSAFQPSEVLHQATAAGAAYLGLGETTGVLRKGALADLILLRATDLNMAPLNVPEGIGAVAARLGRAVRNTRSGHTRNR